MRHSFIDKYNNLESPLHKLSASLKIIITFFSMIALTIAPTKIIIYSDSAFLIFILVCIYISKVPLLHIIKRALIILPFIIFMVLMNVFFRQDGLKVIVLILFRALLSILFLLLLVSVTKFSDILKTLSKWHFPKILIIILSFMYRYFFILIDELEKMNQAMKMRMSKNNNWEYLKIFSHIISILFIRSYERAEKVYYAMLMQGFEGEIE